jgi:acyl-CoA synthetase (NDP forming)
LKINKVATLGNKIDLDEADFLDYFAADPRTRVILIYMEGTNDGHRFLAALRRTCGIKPVVILKSGRTPFGRKPPSPTQPASPEKTGCSTPLSVRPAPSGR